MVQRIQRKKKCPPQFLVIMLLVLCEHINPNMLASGYPSQLVPEDRILEDSIATECDEGVAGMYACSNIDLLSHLALDEFSNGKPTANDIWGWEDPESKKEYAILGMSDGTYFFDVSIPESPTYIGFLEGRGARAKWRDMKTFENYLYIVADSDDHGVQIMDLNQITSVESPPVTFAESAHYDSGSAQNVAINEESGFAYIVNSDSCSGGLLMLDLSNPLDPVSSGCSKSTGTTHDAQCVNYRGADVRYTGKEICIVCNFNTIAILDVTDKSDTKQISILSSNDFEDIIQGWLTADQTYFIAGDKKEDMNTRTYAIDVSNLRAPQISTSLDSGDFAQASNVYVKGGHAYLAKFRAGLRILSLSQLSDGVLTEDGFFDIFPFTNDIGRDEGAWGVYPFLTSGIILVSGVESGLFILHSTTATESPTSKPTRTASPTSSPLPTLTPTFSEHPTKSPAPSFKPTISTAPTGLPSAAPFNPTSGQDCRRFMNFFWKFF